VSNTSEIPYLQLTTFSPSIWTDNNGKNEKMQRIYGISFKDKKLLKNWVENR
jgi:threonyl-tRNA synthetase